jgi:hypothetical protein
MDLSNPKAGSHLIQLAEGLVATTGAVLEVGRGAWSTPFLWRYCVAAGRELVSVDDQSSWVEAFPQFPGEVVDYDAFVPLAAAREWGVVLLDHSPGVRRAADAVALRHAAARVVVHDLDNGKIAGSFAPVLGLWPVRKLRGSTLVLVR